MSNQSEIVDLCNGFHTEGGGFQTEVEGAHTVMADRLTKGLSATVREQLDQELDRIRLDLIKLDITK